MSNAPVEVKKTPVSRETHTDPWQALQHEINRLFDRFDTGLGFPSMRRLFDMEPTLRQQSGFKLSAPAVDVSEDDTAYKITAELPGIDEKNIEISVSGDRLILKGEKRQEKEEKDKNHYLSERSYGSFERSFYLPEAVDQDKIAATFTKGVLCVTLPKTTEAQKHKKIEIKAA